MSVLVKPGRIDPILVDSGRSDATLVAKSGRVGVP